MRRGVTKTIVPWTIRPALTKFQIPPPKLPQVEQHYEVPKIEEDCSTLPVFFINIGHGAASVYILVSLCVSDDPGAPYRMED